MRDVGTDLVVHSWDIRAQVKLGFIQILDKHWKGISLRAQGTGHGARGTGHGARGTGHGARGISL